MFSKVAKITTRGEDGVREYIVWTQDGTSVETLRRSPVYLRILIGGPFCLTPVNDSFVVASGHEVLENLGDLIVLHNQAMIFSDGRPGRGIVFNGGEIIEIDWQMP